MNLYPLNLLLEGRRCLVVGGGAVATRRVGSLVEVGAQVVVVSPVLTMALQELAESQRIVWHAARYAPAYLEDVLLVFAATNDRAVNRQIALDAHARGLLVNIADAPEEGDFVVPSVVRRGDLCISVTTGGSSPLLVTRLCAEIETQFGPEYAEYVELLGHFRTYIKEITEAGEARRQALMALLEAESALLEPLRLQERERAYQLATDLVEQVLRAHQTGE